jgi:DNA-binding SARP family transcriptional activator
MLRGLLAALLLHRGEWVSRGRLMTLMWDEPPASAAENLRGYAMRLRRLLASAGVASRLVTRPGGGGYRLAVADDEVDSAVFATLHDTGRSALHQGLLSDAKRLLDGAVGLWRGPAGEDVPDTVELRGYFDALNERLAEALEDTAEARLLVGEPIAVVPDLITLTSRFPLRERAWELLLLAQCSGGDWLGAAASYARMARLLDDELGVAPSLRLQTLRRAILRRDSAVVTRPRVARR